MDSWEQPSTAAAPVLYEVFTTPYTNEDVARGVRANQSIDRGVLVEVAHCIRIPKDEYEHHLRYSVLEHYLFVGRDGGMLLALGVGSLFNHSQQPNLNYTVDHDRLVIRYRAARAIAAHEELTISYGSSSKLWFEDRSVKSSESSRVGTTVYQVERQLLAGMLDLEFTIRTALLRAHFNENDMLNMNESHVSNHGRGGPQRINIEGKRIAQPAEDLVCSLKSPK